MSKMIRVPFFVGMVLLTIVSMWTTYASLTESILPVPTIDIPMGYGGVWKCSVFALGLSVAIGLMLFSLKLAIIDDTKRLSVRGLLGLTIVAFISITFNMDVLYRMADKDFFIRYSGTRVKTLYGDYLAEVQGALNEKRMQLRKQLAEQEGELEAEVRGLREDPEGYGPVARKEDYMLTKLQKINEVELTAIEEAIASKAKAEKLLAESEPKTLDDIERLQNELRVAVTDIGAVTGLRLPEAVKPAKPLFAVFDKLFDFKNIGWEEIFFLALAFFLDLGDIVGYSLVPKGKKRTKKTDEPLPEVGLHLPSPEDEETPAPLLDSIYDPAEEFFRGGRDDEERESRVGEVPPPPFRFRRR